MTDQDENRPLSRREIRLREMAEAGLQTEAAPPQPASSDAPGEADGPVEPEFEVEIPLLDEHGRPRSRRELRALREQAIAELRGADADASVEDQPSDSGFDPELAETAAFDVLAYEAELQAEAEAEAEADTEVDAELSDQGDVAESSEETAFDALLQEATVEEAGVDELEISSEEDELSAEEEAELASADEEPEAGTETGLEAEAEVGLEADVDVDAEPEVDTSAAPEADAESDVDAGADAEPEIDAEPVARSEAESVTEVAADAEPASSDNVSPAAPVAASVGQSYSFPDITPLDDGKSIFDDPTLQVMNSAPSKQVDGTHDFDELITRAVAQESAGSSTNTSALILPSMPESGALAGPIGETGELFITGSFDLPRSLSETGGHASLHDSIDAEPFDELGLVEAARTGAMAPVSASRAVSARASHGPLVADATRDKNKMPVVLIATGGVLVLGAAGLIIWAATSGLFG